MENKIIRGKEVGDKIMALIKEKSPISIYGLYKVSGLSYPTIYNRVKVLELEGIVSLEFRLTDNKLKKIIILRK